MYMYMYIHLHAYLYITIYIYMYIRSIFNPRLIRLYIQVFIYIYIERERGRSAVLLRRPKRFYVSIKGPFELARALPYGYRPLSPRSESYLTGQSGGSPSVRSDRGRQREIERDRGPETLSLFVVVSAPVCGSIHIYIYI